MLARQAPAWEPGTRQAYHAITLGYYESELLRRVDPKHRTLGQFFQDEIASPLGLDAYIRLPEGIPNARLATIEHPSLGLLTLDCDSLHVPDSDQTVIVYSAEPGTPDADALALLRVLGTQSMTTVG